MFYYLLEQLSTVDFYLIFEMAMAVICGSIIGRERKKHDKPAGSRTVSLVTLSATLIASLSQILSESAGIPFDISRMPAYAITGIGFLGGGIIIHHKRNIEGMTTASTMWVMVPIGLLIGFGEYLSAGLATLFTYVILESKKEDV